MTGVTAGSHGHTAARLTQGPRSGGGVGSGPGLRETGLPLLVVVVVIYESPDFKCDVFTYNGIKMMSYVTYFIKRFCALRPMIPRQMLISVNIFLS